MIDVAVLIDGVGVKALHRISGIPVRTLFRWRANNSLPGRGARRAWTLKHFRESVKKAQAENRKARAKKGA